MFPLITDSQLDSLALIVVAIIGIVPATLAAFWARGARTHSLEANKNANEAKENSAGALHEVKANGGMDDPDPTLKDYIKWVGENVARNSRRIDSIEEDLSSHIRHSKVMDAALAEVFFVVRPDTRLPEEDRLTG